MNQKLMIAYRISYTYLNASQFQLVFHQSLTNFNFNIKRLDYTFIPFLVYKGNRLYNQILLDEDIFQVTTVF